MRKIVARCLILGLLLIVADAVYLMYTGKAGGSHPVSKHYQAEFEIGTLQGWADKFKERLVRVPGLDNAIFVSTTQLYKDPRRFDERGEFLDPWGQPYVIRRDHGQIIITSRELDHYNQLSWFQKLLSCD